MSEEAKAKWSAAFARSAENVSAANAAGIKGDVENGGEVLYSEGDVEITLEDVQTLRSIDPRQSINEFTSEDIKKAEPWARKFFRELGVKSPFFRAWFGDWREFDKQTAKIIDTKGDTRKEKINLDTGWVINTSRKVHKETSHHSGSSERNAVKYLPFIDDITENAVLLNSAISDKKNENSLMFHYFYAYTEVMGYPALLKLQVEELYYYNRNESGIHLRDYILQNIEEEPISKRNRFSRPNHLETSSSTYSISDLFALVKQYDTSFNPKPASKVVNDDGTPKVMYHGTKADFTVFDRSKSTKKIHLNVLGDGNYFTSSAEGASHYGDNVMETYLSIKNPYVFRSTEYNTVADQIPAEFDIERSTFKDSDVSRILKGKSYDGVILYNSDGDIVVENAFSSTQIKSATDNIGKFDGTNPDIRYSEYDDTSMREVLSGALLETAQSNAERSTASRFPAVTHQLNIGSITARKYSVIVSGLSAILREIQ